ncbi:MAG: glutamate-1-semialdehyde 2,1-aminomutase [Ferroplasma sp.]|uniref:glutamate-1-semialdehyde 2,1-aminomutase n=1 Tax=Ferroplasma sp. TaxID=2591003 RepID=UPI002815A5F1|nr:glutamate-1-semialdehyde 2,1-aminomutase [Ferroplasma sp.]WMT51337.1 MAG: glutamate-1-semialdehyde 2,1-aminomutase [Ferroplasma sp.]
MRSSNLFKEAMDIFPMGVNSPVRYYSPEPVMFQQARGSRAIDVNGKEYIDYSMGFGPMILGHANPEVGMKIKEQVDRGILFGSLSENEIKLGKKIKNAVKSIDMLRFTNSGTEATMHAIRVARGFTGRKYILKMEGGYHGAHDYALIKSGSGTMTFGVPSSSGVPEEVSRTVLVGQYNDTESIEKLFREYGNEIAAVITEPVLGNIGVVNPKKDFLKSLREITEKYSSLLIFDEVITGFRFAFSGYQDIIGIKPDITTMGKIIGGGAPVGMFGGRSDVMEKIAPAGNVYEAGTFSGNPLTMAAGVATLDILKTKDYSQINGYAERLEKELNSMISEYGINAVVNRCYSMFQIFFNKKNVTDYSTATQSDTAKFNKMFHGLLEKGIFFPPSQFETEFISFAHNENDFQATVDAMSAVLKCL